MSASVQRTPEETAAFKAAMAAMQASFAATAAVDIHAACRIADAMDVCQVRFSQGDEAADQYTLLRVAA